MIRMQGWKDGTSGVDEDLHESSLAFSCYLPETNDELCNSAPIPRLCTRIICSTEKKTDQNLLQAGHKDVDQLAANGQPQQRNNNKLTMGSILKFDIFCSL